MKRPAVIFFALAVASFTVAVALGIEMYSQRNDDAPEPLLVPSIAQEPFAPSFAGFAPPLPPQDALCSTAYDWSPEETKFLTLLNNYRRSKGLQPYAKDWRPSKSAQWKQDHEVRLQYMAHDDIPINRTWTNRFRDCRADLSYAWGEDLLCNAQTPEAALDVWQHSPGHNALLLSPDYRSVGVGFTAGEDQSLEFKNCWGIDFSAAPPAWFYCADMNSTGYVTIPDLRYVQQHYGTTDTLANLDGVGTVALTDVQGANAQYGTYCTRY